MNGKVKLIYTISKEAYSMVKKGGAVLQSGGVRNVDGSLMELAVPGVQNAQGFSIPGNVFPGINMVSSLANNVQSAFIQKGVNEANRKLKEVLSNQALMINKLNVISGLQVANLAVGFVTLAVSVKNFADIKKQLDDVKVVLIELTEHIQKKEIFDYIEDYDKYAGYMTSSIEHMQHTTSLDYNIAKSLADVEAFLAKIIRMFNEREIDGNLGCEIIFGLTPCYVQAVKMYSSICYYTCGEVPDIYNKCVKVLEMLNSETFRNMMKQYLMINSQGLTMQELYNGFSGIMGTIKYTTNNYQFEPQVWAALPQKEYLKLDQILQNQIMEDKSVAFDEERAYITVS